MASSQNEASLQTEKFDDVKMSLKGMDMLLNNHWDAAGELFLEHKDKSPLMYAGAGWVNHLQAMMSFEDDKQQQTIKLLQEIEKKCSVKRVKKKSKGSYGLAEKFQCQVIVADAIVHQALLHFLNQDVASYIKGGWMIRKSYKMYQKLYKEVHKLYQLSLENKSKGIAVSKEHQDILQAELDDLETTSSNDSPDKNNSMNSKSQSEAATNHNSSQLDDGIDSDVEEATEAIENLSAASSSNGLEEITSSSGVSSASVAGTGADVLTHDVIERLYGSVSFGHGLFQLVLSLIPPKVIKIVEFLGFDCDRAEGLRALEVSSKTQDMKAPMASLAILWYHTVIRAFFALDGNNIRAGAEAAQPFIDDFEQRYPKSGLFLYFKGRAQRLRSSLDAAVHTYKTALENSSGQREMELMCNHEIGWIEMMRLNIPECIKRFVTLRENTRWSKSFYSYLCGLCHGALGDTAEAKKYFKEVPSLVKKKNNEIEHFANSRAKKFEKKVAVTPENCVLYMMEVVYLWNCITQCPQAEIDRMIAACNKVKDKSVFALNCLIEGALYREKDNYEISTQCFEEALARSDDKKTDVCIQAWATYELGMNQCANSKTFQQGKKNITKARDGFKDFDFDNRLHVRVNNALKRIETVGTPT